MKRYLSLMILFGLSVAAFAQNGKARKSDGTECTAFPCVVAMVSLTDQTAPIAQTALFTPTTSGLFRLTYYMESSHMQGSLWEFQYTYTDDLKTRVSPLYEFHQSQYGGEAFTLRDVAGQPITYAITEGTNAEGTNYDLFITVEQLQ